MSGSPVMGGPASTSPGAILGVVVGVVDSFGNRRLLASSISDAIDQEPALRKMLLKGGGDVLFRSCRASSDSSTPRSAQATAAMPNEQDFLIVSEEEELQALMRSASSVLLYAYYSPGDHPKKTPDAIGRFRKEVLPLITPLQKMWEFEVAYTIVGVSREFLRGLDVFRTQTSVHDYLKQRSIYFPGLHLFTSGLPSGSARLGIKADTFDYFSDAYKLLYDSATVRPDYEKAEISVEAKTISAGSWELAVTGGPNLDIVYKHANADYLYVNGELVLERGAWEKLRNNHPAYFEFEHDGHHRSGFVVAHPITGEIALVLDGELVYWSNWA